MSLSISTTGFDAVRDARFPGVINRQYPPATRWSDRDSSPEGDPRMFVLVRDQDVSGVSGTGIVAEGVAWSDGSASLRWRGTFPSVVFWPGGVPVIMAVHGHGGATRVRYLRSAVEAAPDDLVAPDTRQTTELTEALRLARTDELTSLLNRRALLVALDDALATDGPVGLMLVDLDGFKIVNDTYGHPVGDHVLRAVAGRLLDAAGPGDVVARLGGDEFAVLTCHDDLQAARQHAHRIQDALVRGPITTVADVPITIGASIGATIRVPDDSTPADLLARADAAMYQNKIIHGRAMKMNIDSQDLIAYDEQVRRDIRRSITLDLNLLRAFVHLADVRSLATAADDLRCTVTDLNHRMATLDRALGARLLVRRGRGIFPTPRGSRLLPFVRVVLTTVDALRASRAEASSSRTESWRTK
jgi:diguanylate cyclase (GGDEF)-like protein